MTKYRDEFTPNKSDAELADRLNDLTNFAGFLVLPLPMEFIVGRGYEAIISTSYPDRLPLVSTYYDRRKAAGAVLRDGTWHPEHSVEDERAYRQRQIDRYTAFARGHESAMPAPAPTATEASA